MMHAPTEQVAALERLDPDPVRNVRPQSPAAGGVHGEVAAEAAPSRAPANPAVFSQPPRPRLSRKIVASARVNLNRYWSQFEESTRPITVMDGDRSSLDGEISGNLAEEIRELGN
ncbi:hypothetical protein BDFB_004709 [Asbolus verrucosus]|uniref:Uncharacterized protein n=1 Tax=Asbolus verrucosus TaxID=1661398 RepID=A0A482VBZ1_ASBVE|nr:hypothetical protein BDFB_004709 [Asbolus verrucosus]